MSTIVLRLPDVQCEATSRPDRCPFCGGGVLPRRGRVTVYRYRCTTCGRAFRHYPAGARRACQTQRLEKLAALMWGMGLSLRGVAAVLAAFGVALSRMSVWREGQQVAAALRGARRRRPVRVPGVDGAWVRQGGGRRGVMVAVDLAGGAARPVDIAVIEESDVDAVRAWLSELVAGLGVEVVVTDDLNTDKALTSEPGVSHQLCRFHSRRRVGRALWEYEAQLGAEWQPVLAEVAQILREMPPDGGKRLFRLPTDILAPPPAPGEKASARYRLARLLWRLSEDGHAHGLFQQREGVPSTNNGTERIIGRLKGRSHSVRGYKSQAGIESLFHLSTAVA